MLLNLLLINNFISILTLHPIVEVGVGVHATLESKQKHKSTTKNI